MGLEGLTDDPVSNRQKLDEVISCSSNYSIESIS
jgi:hypothetical protein